MEELSGTIKPPAILRWIPFLFKPVEFSIDTESIYSCDWKFKDNQIKTVSVRKNFFWTSVFVISQESDEPIFVARASSENAESITIVLESISRRNVILNLANKIVSFLNEYKYISRSESLRFVDDCNKFDAPIPSNIGFVPLKDLQEAYRTIALVQTNINMNATKNPYGGDSWSQGEFYKLVDKHNLAFVEKEKDAHKELFDNIESNPLTDRQKEAAIKNEDFNLVVAGAGTGKTSCVVARIGYLLKQGLASPNEILVLAYTKDAKKELEERIKKRLHINDVTIRTFHSLGQSICTDADKKRPSLSPLAGDKVAMGKFVEETVKEAIENNQSREAFIEFVAYFREELINKWDFDSINEYLQKLAQTDLRTLKGERVKSQEELRIANWLTLNGVEYEYEKDFPFENEDKFKKRYQPDFYLADYDIYLEHFGVSESGETAPGIDSSEYLKGMDWKRQKHQRHDTTLIETYSYQHRNRTWKHDLKSLLVSNGVKFKEVSTEQILARLKGTGQQKRFSEFLQSYIALLKTTDVCIEDLESNIPTNHDSLQMRAETFLPVLKYVFKKYQNNLDQNSKIDYGDMIQLATSHVNNARMSPYKHIIVDEFQDISTARANLLRAIISAGNDTRLFCVGDDWQSIFRFAGSDVKIMSDFENQFGFFARTDLDITFRYPKKLLSAASRFVQQNPLQLRKKIHSSIPSIYHSQRNTQKSIEIAFYTGGQRELQDDEVSLGDQLKNIIEDIKENSGTSPVSILVLGRYNYLKDEIPSMSSLNKSSNVKVTFQTVHGAKGAEADYVIVLSVIRGRYGFPKGIADDPLYQLVLGEADNYPNAEERRLFYVALTRAKRKCYLLTSESYRSLFIDELLGVEYAEEVDAPEQDFEPANCPECDGRVVMRKGENGTFWSCEYFPSCEGKLNICKECKVGAVVRSNNQAKCSYIKCGKTYELCVGRYCDGYYILRPGKIRKFYSCSNWPTTRCNHKKKYYG